MQLQFGQCPNRSDISFGGAPLRAPSMLNMTGENLVNACIYVFVNGEEEHENEAVLLAQCFYHCAKHYSTVLLAHCF